MMTRHCCNCLNALRVWIDRYLQLLCPDHWPKCSQATGWKENPNAVNTTCADTRDCQAKCCQRTCRSYTCPRPRKVGNIRRIYSVWCRHFMVMGALTFFVPGEPLRKISKSTEERREREKEREGGWLMHVVLVVGCSIDR